VIAKTWYKHPKEFEIEFGKEIEIFPMIFLGEAKKDYKVIMKHLEKEKLRGINSQLIEEKIEGIIKKNRGILKGYQTRSQKRRDLVCKLIMNELILRQLDNCEENMKKAFNQVKDKWPEYVYSDIKNSGDFIVDEAKLLNCLQNNTKINKPDYSENSLWSSSTNQSLLRSDLNLELLKSALEVYAFRNQSVDLKAISSRIVLKEKVEKSCIERFFKMDLCEIQPSGNTKIDYGIKFEIKNSRLCFHGVPEEDCQGKTFVVQITNAKHRILKEILIHGRPCEAMKEDRCSVMNNEGTYEAF